MNDLPLGKAVEYAEQYDPQLLFAIDRQLSRDSLGIAADALPFKGVDIWNAYELSWLTPGGKPQVACAEFRFSCKSASIVESKSFKLYLNSLNQTRFDNQQALQATLERDLSACVQSPVSVAIYSVDDAPAYAVNSMQGVCLDTQDIDIDNYHPDPQLLSSAGEQVHETLYSHLLRSLCPVTGQPDWGSVIIRYSGSKIDHAALLTYLVGYRRHQEFHEQCVERIYTDIFRQCEPQQLSVYARYVRRGGLDINPFRSSDEQVVDNNRLQRQ